MKKLRQILWIVPLVIMFMVNVGWGQLLLTEDFSYTVGDSIGAHNWTAFSGGFNNIKVVSPGLVFSNYTSSGIGYSCRLSNNAIDNYKNFKQVSSCSVYCSFMINVDSAQLKGDYCITFLPSTSTTMFTERFYVLDSLGGIWFGITKGSMNGNPVNWTPTSYSKNTTYLIVLKYTFNTGTTTDDQLSLFVFQSGNDFNTEPTPTVGPITNSAGDASDLGRVVLRQGSATIAPTVNIDGIRVATSWAGVVLPPTLTEVFLPQYIQGDITGINTNRVPYVYCVTLSNLLLSKTYRYYNQVVSASDEATTDGAGNIIFINNSGDFARSIGPSMSSAGNYGEFTTDGTGSYKGWFITEPTANTHFTPGTSVFMRIMLNDGAGWTTVITRLTTTNSATVINLVASVGATNGTGFHGISNNVLPKNFLLFYDNVDGIGTARPISGTFVESDGTDNTTGNGYAQFYSDYVNGVANAWGTIIPNTLPNGIRRIEERRLFNSPALAPGDLVNFNTWPSGYTGTVNPSGGTTSIDYGNAPLPVELSSFTSNIITRDVKLNWTTASENNNAGFEILRSAQNDNGSWTKVGYVTGNGTKTTPTNYSFEDKNLNTGKYNYRLKQIDYNGNFEYFNLAGEVEIGVPKKFDISQNYPNPFNPTAKIDFDLPFDSKVSMKLYDISGREVMTLVNEQKSAGYYTVQMNGNNLSSGMYFYRIIAEGNGQKYVMTKKAVLIK
jgi:hypothetical protein